MDSIYRALKERYNGETTLKFCVPFLVPGVIIVPVGIFLYGWSVEK